MAANYAARAYSFLSHKHYSLIVSKRLLHSWKFSPLQSFHVKTVSFNRLLTVSAVKLTKDSKSEEFFQPTPTFTGTDSVHVAGQSTIDVAQQAVDITSLGLGGYTPSGMIQLALESLYNHFHLPWWGCIVACTVFIRLILFPLIVKAKIIAAKLALIQDDVNKLNAKMKQCKSVGDQHGQMEAGIELMQLYQRQKVHPLSFMLLGFAQAPPAISMLYGLKGMSLLPVESMKVGGMLWFPDLTCPDPLFCLPIIGSASFVVNLMMGGEAETVENEFSRNVRKVLYIGAICILPVTTKLTAAVQFYFVANSLFSAAQILLFKVPSFKLSLKIPIVPRKLHKE